MHLEKADTFTIAHLGYIETKRVIIFLSRNGGEFVSNS